MKGLCGHEIDLVKIPVTSGWYPELDNSPELTNVLHTLFMQLICIDLWISIIECFDICSAILSLSRYTSASQNNHIIELKKVFGHLKSQPDKHILTDSSDPGNQGDLVKEYADISKFYPDTKEDIGDHPEPRGKEIASSIWFDSDHAHDKKTTSPLHN